MSIPFKPRGSAARSTLKHFKNDFDDSFFDSYELLVELNVLRAITESLRAYKGEFLHQLALRKERRSELAHAEQLYVLSFDALKGNPLGQARTTRDHGTMLVAHGDKTRGFKLIETARALHDQDVDNQKGRRQRLITESYLWRAQVIADEPQADQAKHRLIELATGPDFNFCQRDKKVIIDFLVTRTRGERRRDMLARQAAINLERRKLFEAIRAATALVVDIELSITSSIVRRLLRKE